MTVVYGLHKTGDDGTLLHPIHDYITEEGAASRYDLYLTDRIEKTDKGDILFRYRLHARHPHNIEMALAYDITCPKCRNRMKQVSRCLNSHELGEYACKKCDRR